METIIPLTEFSLLAGLSAAEQARIESTITPAMAIAPVPYSALGHLYHTSKVEEICSLLNLDIQGTRRMMIDGELSFHFVTYSRRSAAPLTLSQVVQNDYITLDLACDTPSPIVPIETVIIGPEVCIESIEIPSEPLPTKPIALEFEPIPAELSNTEVVDKKSYSVEIKSWDGSHGVRQWLIPYLETTVAPTLKMDIVVHVPHGVYSPPLVDGKFHIYFYSAPFMTERNSPYPPDTLYSQKVLCTDCNGLGYGDIGTPINSNGYILGEIIQDNAYVYFDAVHTMGESTTCILQCILNDIVNIQFDPKIREEELQRRKKRWVTILEKASLYSNEKYRNEIKTSVDKVELLRGDLATTIKKIETTRAMLEILENNKSLVPTDRQWDMLYKHPDVENIVVEDNQVGIVTKIIYCTDPNNQRMYEIGKLLINVTPGVASANIKITNLTRTVTGLNPNMHAPHVFSDNRVCFGNAEGAVTEMLASGHIAGIFILLLKFMQTVNPHDSAGAYVNRWPEVDPTTKRILSSDERAPDPYKKGFTDPATAVDVEPAHIEPIYDDPAEPEEEPEETDEADEFVYEDDIEEED